MKIDKLITENKKLTQNYEKAINFIKKQQKEVVKPLIKECAKREKESQMLRGEVTHRTINLKVMFAMVGSPKLCDLFYKSQRRQYCNNQLKLK